MYVCIWGVQGLLLCCYCVSDSLPNVIEVSVRHCLLRGQLSQLVQQHVQLELRGEVAQAAVAEGFSVDKLLITCRIYYSEVLLYCFIYIQIFIEHLLEDTNSKKYIFQKLKWVLVLNKVTKSLIQNWPIK